MELLGIDLATAFRFGDRGIQALLGGKTDLNLDGAHCGCLDSHKLQNVSSMNS